LLRTAYVTEDKKSRLKMLTMGILVGYAITCIVFLGYSMLITYTNMSEKNLPVVVAITTLVSVMIAGFDAAKGAASRGWLWGMGAGLIYVLILLSLMMTAVRGFAVDGRTVTLIILSIAGGGLGGVLGINTKR
jgi:putative membrane protein (TIGR04086 family)